MCQPRWLASETRRTRGVRLACLNHPLPRAGIREWQRWLGCERITGCVHGIDGEKSRCPHGEPPRSRRCGETKGFRGESRGVWGQNRRFPWGNKGVWGLGRGEQGTGDGESGDGELGEHTVLLTTLTSSQNSRGLATQKNQIMRLTHLPTGQVPESPEVLIGFLWGRTLTLDRK